VSEHARRLLRAFNEAAPRDDGPEPDVLDDMNTLNAERAARNDQHWYPGDRELQRLTRARLRRERR
jgi:hypothetical protein